MGEGIWSGRWEAVIGSIKPIRREKEDILRTELQFVSIRKGGELREAKTDEAAEFLGDSKVVEGCELAHVEIEGL